MLPRMPCAVDVTFKIIMAHFVTVLLCGQQAVLFGREDIFSLHFMDRGMYDLK